MKEKAVPNGTATRSIIPEHPPRTKRPRTPVVENPRDGAPVHGQAQAVLVLQPNFQPVRGNRLCRKPRLTAP
jgi:hypothetical protein